MNFLQIVPRLPPTVDGVGDYALNLACQLHKYFSINTHFLVCDPGWDGETEIEGFSVSRLKGRTTKILIEQVPRETTSILLHYVGYGYAKRGYPLWLIEGLQGWKCDRPQLHLVTMFHEVRSSSRKLWTSSFWLTPLKKRLVIRLLKISDRCLTSKQLYAQSIKELSQGKHTNIPALPVFSNLGEPQNVPPLSLRQNRLVVFGRMNSRKRVYFQSLEQLHYTCQILNIEELWDVGDASGYVIPELDLGQVNIIKKGNQSAQEISTILLNSKVGFLDYNPNFLGKSGIFAAYTAHGMLPVNSHEGEGMIDGLECGKHYWVPEPKHQHSINQPQAIADAAHQWYRTHDLTTHAQCFARELGL